MTLRASISWAATLLLLTGCGGGGNATGIKTGNANFSARVDGAAWTSSATSTAATGSAGGIFTIVGAPSGTNPTAMSLTLYSIAAPGTYPLGVGGTVRGGIANLTAGGSAWSTPLSGSAGSVTITQVSGTHIAGTFQYVATPFFGSSGSSRTVTEGEFDLPVTSSGSVAVPEYAGSRFGGTLNNAPWNAATVVMVSTPASGTLGLGISNDKYSVTLLISGWTGAVPYALNTGVARYFSVIATGTTNSWGGAGTASTGTVTVTSATSTRITGSYDALLKPANPNAGLPDLTLAGTFDIGIPQ